MIVVHDDLLLGSSTSSWKLRHFSFINASCYTCRLRIAANLNKVSRVFYKQQPTGKQMTCATKSKFLQATNILRVICM